MISPRPNLVNEGHAPERVGLVHDRVDGRRQTRQVRLVAAEPGAFDVVATAGQGGGYAPPIIVAQNAGESTALNFARSITGG